MTDSLPSSSSIPESFLAQLRQVLSNLHNFAYLQGQNLAQVMPVTTPGEVGWQRLRQEVLLAIEALNPGGDIYFRSPRARLYNLLNLHYLEEMSIQQTADELGISLRQAHRDLRRAELAVAAALWPKLSGQVPPIESASPAATPTDFQLAVELVNVHEIIEDALESIGELAQQRRVIITVQPLAEPVMIPVDRVVAAQTLLRILSNVVQQVGSIPAEIDQPQPVLEIRLTGSLPPALEIILSASPQFPGFSPPVDPFFLQLLALLGWKMTAAPGVLTLQFASAAPLLLVIDDNEGLPLLLDRFLTGTHYRIAYASDGEKGIVMAQQLAPQGIVLDIMMPGMDGWKVLRRLRAQPVSQQIPIIICSVFNDPALAHSLGATLSLTKPVKREDFLGALKQAGI